MSFKNTMLRVPFYTLENYKKIVTTPYYSQDVSNWISLNNFLEFLTSENINLYARIDSRDLKWYIERSDLQKQVLFGGKRRKLADVLIASKLLLPTLWTCNYNFWDQGKASHGGIDIVLPQWTPIISFEDGDVVRNKKWDGETKDEGNCVVIQNVNRLFSYKHLDTVRIEHGQEIRKWDEIGTCGKTWWSGLFHLHLQIDIIDTPFAPYWSNSVASMEKYTLDPLPILNQIANETHEIFFDMPEEENYKDAIEELHKLWISKWKQNKIYPNDFLPRRQTAIIIARIARKFNLFENMQVTNPIYVHYKDVDEKLDPDLMPALKDLQHYGIMVGFQKYFFPFDDLKWEQWLALLWRMFFGLKDSPAGNWYDIYLLYFKAKNIIWSNWKFVSNSIDRKEMFLITYKVLKKKHLV